MNAFSGLEWVIGDNEDVSALPEQLHWQGRSFGSISGMVFLSANPGLPGQKPAGPIEAAGRLELTNQERRTTSLAFERKACPSLVAVGVAGECKWCWVRLERRGEEGRGREAADEADTAPVAMAQPTTPLRCFRDHHFKEKFKDENVVTVTSVEQVRSRGCRNGRRPRRTRGLPGAVVRCRFSRSVLAGVRTTFPTRPLSGSHCCWSPLT